MRTQEQIIARIEERKQHDMFGFEWHEYVLALCSTAAARVAVTGA